MVTHLSEELAKSVEKVSIQTKYGTITGARAANGAAAFLEVPYALPPRRFEDPQPLPDDFKYVEKEYIHESMYAVQPGNDGQTAGIPKCDQLGLGQPSENPLFLNIVLPPSFNTASNIPVRVYIHGGFLQFGSPHSLSSQAQYVAAERDEIWINIGYRLSAFGFLACDKPDVKGNFGFKDQWLALEWIRDNVAFFGGDVEDIQVTGLSAGAHSVHQILHHASRLPSGQKAPFQSAVLQSNSIVNVPKTPYELRVQYEALCIAIGLDSSSSKSFTALCDPIKTPWKSIVSAIEEEKLGPYGTFRGTLDGSWLASEPDPMTWQRSGGLAKGLRQAGVRSIVIGDLVDEWYLYSIAHPIHSKDDIRTNLLRYYPESLVDAFSKFYPQLDTATESDDCAEVFGKILSDGQVHLPVRLLARDLANSDFPVLRYEIRWTPEQARELAKGYVTHATDRIIWCFRVPSLKDDQISIARSWLAVIHEEQRAIENAGRSQRRLAEVLTLREDKSIGWEEDLRYHEVMRLVQALPGESH